MSAVARAGFLLVALGMLAALQTGRPVAAATVTIDVGSYWFCDSSHLGNVCTTTINVGDTVSWNFTASSHTTTSNTGAWDSGTVASGGMFTHTFNSPGTFAYVCTPHAFFMMGQIVVNAPVGGIAQLSNVAGRSMTLGSPSNGGNGGWVAIGGGIAAVGVVLLGAAWYARLRRRSVLP